MRLALRLEMTWPAGEIQLQEALRAILALQKLGERPTHTVYWAVNAMIPRRARQLAQVGVRQAGPRSLPPQVPRLLGPFSPLLGCHPGMRFRPPLEEQG